MAAPSPTAQLVAEASCPICLDLFQDPVSIPCGHSFCRGCIERCWASSRERFPCPRCRDTAPERSLRPNRELGEIAGIARGLLGAELCRWHREPLRFFCPEQRELLCLVCGRARPHRRHRELPAEEAARGYKEQIQSSLRALREEREKFLESRKCGAGRDSVLDPARREAQRTGRALQQLRRALEQRERLLRARLGALERERGRARDAALAAVTAQISELDTLGWEMEGKWQQPPGRFLQDIPQLLDSCERMKFQPPAEVSPELRRSLEDFTQRNVLVRAALRRCQDSLTFLLQEPADLRLDPLTAHPHLHLSEDGKEARGLLVPRDVPDHPDRFDWDPCVLARGGFTSGRHFWEVEVGPGGTWALGVLRESSRRKGRFTATPERGVWALEVFHSLSSPRARLPPLRPPPRRLRVLLDYEGTRVAFFGLGEDAPILEHTRAEFNGERLLPWFRIGIGERLREVMRGDKQGGSAPLDWVGFGVSLRICS